MTSIRLRLLKWLIGPILLVNLSGAALTYILAWMPAQNAFDQSLIDTAAALAGRVGLEAGRQHVDLPVALEQVVRGDELDAIYFAVRGADGRLLAGDADLPALAGAPQATGSAVDASMRGEPVRMLAREVQAGAQPVQITVAKTMRKRLRSRAAIVRALVLLESVFTLALVGLIWFSISNGLRPLNRLRADLNGRDGADLSPIGDEQVPFELVPVVHAFNNLLDKVQAGASAQHDFLANVAHQLRTPLAGLRTQLELLEQRHQGERDTAHAIGLMLSSTARMIRQTNQLLALARAEPSYFEKTRLEPVELDKLVEESIQHFVEEAARKEIDLGFELAPTVVAGDRFLLRDLIDNLIDNAIRYTPPKGMVTVRCASDGHGGTLTVEDSGPGIAPANRALVFNRFVRLDDKTTGSGLGLAIVRDIAHAHGAQIRVDERAGAPGALFSVQFPA